MLNITKVSVTQWRPHSQHSIKTLIRRWDSECDLFKTTSSTTFTQCAPEATKFSEITQNKGHYAVQHHSRSPLLVPIESSYDFILMINSNLPRILHRFRDIASLGPKSLYLATTLTFNTLDGIVSYIIIFIVSDISLKTKCLALHFCSRKFRHIFNQFYAVRPEIYRI